MDRKGYLQWRNEEKIRHAGIAGKILAEAGYDPDMVEKVKFLLMKKELYTHPDTQLMEDIACLVFLEFYLEEFIQKHEDEKIVDILYKTLKKMSPKAKTAVGEITFSPKTRSLIDRAVNFNRTNP